MTNEDLKIPAAIVVVPTAFADNGNHYGQAKNGNNGKHNGGGCPGCG